MLPAVLGPRSMGSSLLAWARMRPTTPVGHRSAARRWMLWSCVIAIVVLLVSLAAGNHQRHEQGFDVFDEGAHYDYVLDLTHGHLPRSGETVSQTTMRMISCLGGFELPPHGCKVTKRNPALFPAAGYSYEAVQQPPLGYLPYIVTARSSGAPESALVDTRWGGFVWSVVGAGLLLWVGWLAELSLLELCLVLSICLLSPVEVHAASTVTNDSSAVPAGALVLATFLVSRRRQTAMAGFGLAVGLLVGLMKGLFVVAPLVILVGLVIGDVSQRRRPTRADLWRRYGCSLSMFVGVVISYAGWLLLQDAVAVVSPSVVLHALQGISTTPYPRPSTFFNGIQQGLSDLIAYTPAPLYWFWNLAVYGSLAGLLVLKGPVGRPQVRAMAAAVFIGIAALAAAFPLLNFVEGHYDFYAPSRYAVPLLPIVGVVLARALRTRGLLLIGIALPALAVIDQLATGQF